MKSQMNQGSIFSQNQTTPHSIQPWEENLKRTALLFSRKLEPEEVTTWQDFLKGNSSQAIEWAFENWQRNAKFFPKPKDILDLLSTWKVENRLEFKSCGKCEEGFIRIFEGKTAGGHNINPKFGAMTRCECWLDWRGRAA